MKSSTRIFGMIFGLVLACTLSATAQTSGATFSTSSEAVGIHFNNAWTAGNHTTETLDLLDWGVQKGNSLAVEGHEILAPSANFNSYLGGIRITPDISSLMAKTNIPSDQFGVFAQAAAGSSTLTAGNKFTFLVGGGANYRMTTNLAWSTVDARWGRIGSQTFYEVSSGLVYYINPQTAQSVATRRFLARRTARANAFKNAGW
jgi:hypothetical protein